MSQHEKYMQRCLQLAHQGLSSAKPNPSVGAVLVYNDRIIGEGYTSAYGGPHAEVNAIQSVKDRALLSRCTLYVSLEPCSHFGKTPPCCDLILVNQIPKIVIGCSDSNPLVGGKSIEKLKSAGKEVIVGVLEKECRELNKRFFTFHTKNRPYVILKWAQSKDGFIAPTHEIREEKQEKKRAPFWISNVYSRQLTHKWRTEEQAILIGTQTAIDDNPRLDARDWSGPQPIKIVLDRHGRIPKENYIFDSPTSLILLSEKDLDFSQPVANQILEMLYQRNIASVIVEGGRQTLQTFIDEQLWDEARVFIGADYINEGIHAPKIKATVIERKAICDDELLTLTSHD